MVVDLTPTWTGLVLVLAEIYASKHDRGAQEELVRMAGIADSYVAITKANEPKEIVVDEEKKTMWISRDPYEFEIITDEYYQKLLKFDQEGYWSIKRTQKEFDDYAAARKTYRDFRTHAMLDAGII